MPPSTKLHIGAYDVVLDGWINTDVTPQLLIARVLGLAALLFALGRLPRETYARHRQGAFRAVTYLDVTKRFSYADNTFDYVFSEHVLEHLYPDEAVFCLSEVYRVLKPSGLVRTALPDLDQIVATYDPNNTEGFLFSIYQGRRRDTHERARHWWHYNERSLGALLRRVGFREVERCAFRRGRCADVERLDRREGSLIMEAVK
jgi:SAM-dependent methyltransferase